MESLILLRRWTRKLRWAAGLAALVAACTVVKPERVPIPTALEVSGAGPLQVTLHDMRQRPLRPDEVSSPVLRGSRWDFRLRIANPSSIGVAVARLRQAVIDDTGDRRVEEGPFPLQVAAGGSTEAIFSATIATSRPADDPVQGIDELTFAGTLEGGNPLSFVVRVPLR